MKCNFPMLRAETYERYTNQKGGISYKHEFLPRTMADEEGGIENLRKIFAGKYRKIQYTGCGQCVPCLLNYSADKATQMMMHKNFGYNGGPYPDGLCWFITCTYDDVYLKTTKTIDMESGEIFEGISLYLKDHQDFMKRLRKHFNNSKIQYVCAGEYGSQTHRPHLHYIMYGLPLPQETFIKRGMNKMNQPTWSCQELTDIWGMGMVTIGRVEWQSCAYVARYTLKKAFKKDKWWYLAQGMQPEFIIWSNGIGKQHLVENYKDIYKTDTVQIFQKGSGRNVKPPKSYDRMLKEIDPELYEEIKRKRDNVAKTREYMLNQTTDLTPEERRIISEARMKQVMKDIRLEV